MIAGKLSTRAELFERLKDMLVMEKGAEHSYGSDVLTFRNFVLVDTIEQIRKDEVRHIHLLEECMALTAPPPAKGAAHRQGTSGHPSPKRDDLD
jgi:hypothetical protein